jgi:hypothetical protein
VNEFAESEIDNVSDDDGALSATHSFRPHHNKEGGDI